MMKSLRKVIALSLGSYHNLSCQGTKSFPKFALIFVLSIFCFTSCGEKEKEEYLKNGLSNYRKVRNVNENILDGYAIKKLAFFKLDSLKYEFVFQLNEDASSDTIEKYGLGIVYFADKQYLDNEKGYLIYQMKPQLEKYNTFKYIIETVTPPATYLDSIHIYLSGRENYTGVIGKMIRLKNIELK